MKTKLLFSVFLLAQLSASSTCFGDDGSARRYAEFEWNDELSLTFCLLARDDVQHELKMAAKQVVRVKHAECAGSAEIPGLMDLLQNGVKKQSDPTLSASEKHKLTKTAISEVKTRTESYQRKELSATLSVDQRQRLDELLLQMRGPTAILDNRAIWSKLQLSEKQKAEMIDTVKNYEKVLGWLRAR